jgi:galactokinase
VQADPRADLTEAFGCGGEIRVTAAPGRVNLIGEHVDYHGLPVLPMALRRRIRVAYRPRTDRQIRAVSAGYGRREFEWTPELSPAPAGDWENYARAAAQAVARKWGAGVGVDAAVVSDLPPAAGLSSSSALLVAFTLALLEANRQRATFEELMEILPEGEQFVGTRGGGMDHAASLASKAGCASLIGFDPLSVRAIPMPDEWGFLVAHSLRTAEKSGPVREAFNARRRAGTAALARLGYASYREAVASEADHEKRRTGRADARLMTPEGVIAGQKARPHVRAADSEADDRILSSALERDAFLHVTGEALRVTAAVKAMEAGDAATFGRLLLESHASLRDRLKVSCPELDSLVDAAMESGALGARLTGAGFGGCAVVFAAKRDLPAVREGLMARFYAKKAGGPTNDVGTPARATYLIDAEPGPGALYRENS